MPKRVQHVRHTESAANLYVGLAGQITIDTTNNEIRVHNGSTAGGIRTARQDLANVAAATSGNDGKMTSTQVNNLAQVITDLDALETVVGALNGDDIAYTNAGTNLSSTIVGDAIDELDSDLADEITARTAHGALTNNPHSVTAAQAGALAIAQDLGDLNDAPTAVGNLGIAAGDDSIWGAGTETAQSVVSPANVRSAINSYLNREAGEIIVLGYVATVAGLVRCGGQALSRTTYSALFAKIGTTFGVGDGSTTFNVPNLVKKFMLGADDNDTDFDIASTGGAFEITQTGDQVGSHGHEWVQNRGGENQVSQENSGGIITSTAAPNPTQPANATEPSTTAGDQIGWNQDQADVDPMDITNPFIALPVYITTGGV